MEKDEFVHLANEFYQDALIANSYYSLLDQYEKNRKDYFPEMQMSSAFYTITHYAVVEALFMNLARIYDNDAKAISVKKMLLECKNNVGLLKECSKRTDFPHVVEKNENWYFEDNKEVKTQKNFQPLFSSGTVPITINLTIEEYLDFYSEKLCSLNPKTKNLRIQRNKLYAHKDASSISDLDTTILNSPLYMNDIQVLIEYALNVGIFVLGCLTNIQKPTQYVNINDWRGSLQLVRIGEKWKYSEINSNTHLHTD